MTERVEPSRTRHERNSTEPARQPRLFLILSVSLNLGLLLFLASTWQRSAPPAVPTIPLPDNTNQESSSFPGASAKRVFTRPAPSLWKQLESNELAVYAANLRAAGCPPKTVRDILLPLIEEKFEHPESTVSAPTHFWASFSERQSAAIARAEQESVLAQQKNEMLEELLEFAWASEGLKQAYSEEAAGSVGFLEFERAEKFLSITDKFKKQLARAGSPRRPDRHSAIYEAWRQEVGEVLSSTDCEEIELRALLTIYQRRNPDLCKAGLSGSELRQLMAFRRELCNPLPSTLLAGGDDLLHNPDWVRVLENPNSDRVLHEPDCADEKQFHAKVRGLLGDNRFLDYLKNGDVSIERTLAALENERLPRSLALELFDFRQEAMARAEEIRQLPVRRAEKRAHLTALRQSVLEQVAALSDGAIESALFQANEDWLQQIAHP